MIELALRRRIALVKDPNRKRVPLPERLVEVLEDRQTGETILDEALKLMKMQQETERLSVNSWIDLLSGACEHHFFLSPNPTLTKTHYFEQEKPGMSSKLAFS